MSFLRSLPAAGLALSLTAGSAQAVTIVFDTFENGVNVGETSTKGNDAFDTADIAWFSALLNGTASLQNDPFAGGGSAKALDLSSPDTFRRMGGNFPSTTLGANIGDKLTLSFDMRFTQAPAANQLGFRFGLYNSAGTNIATDNPNGVNQPAEQNDDFGYVVKVSTGASATLENSITDEPAGDNPTGGTIAGTVIGTGATPVAINDQNKHTLSLTLERTGPSLIGLSFLLDGINRASAIDNTPVLTFDTIYFAKGSIATNFRVDNVRLESLPASTAVVIPEPATALLGLLTLGTLARRTRRGRA